METKAANQNGTQDKGTWKTVESRETRKTKITRESKETTIGSFLV